LEVDGAQVKPMSRPPLLPTSWKTEGVRQEKVKEEMDKANGAQGKVEEEKEASKDATIQRRVSEVTVRLAGL
jgi:hypothetical protein